jgi:uncharacterized membrane protein
MKTVRLVCCFCLLLVCLLATAIPGLVLAQDEVTGITENVTLSATFPTVEAIAGGTFAFEVELSYLGESPKVFDLRVSTPAGWDVYMTPQYEKDKKISSITLKPSFGTGETILVNATAPLWPLPEPGDYKIKLEAVSDKLKGSIELTAKITARYSLQMVPTSQLYNTNAKSGKDNYFSIEVGNPGTAAINNIKFSSANPEGWAVEFKPEKIDLLEAFDSQTVQLNIKPPAKTIAGDYNITLRASGTQTSTDEVKIRVTVQTSTIWGWVGVVIILIVVIGLVVIFMRFSRR